MEGYKHTGPVDCNVDFDPGAVKGKTAIVTGGECVCVLETLSSASH